MFECKYECMENISDIGVYNSKTVSPVPKIFSTIKVSGGTCQVFGITVLSYSSGKVIFISKKCSVNCSFAFATVFNIIIPKDIL